MATVIGGRDVIRGICEALGIDPALSQRVVIDIAYDSVPVVYVQRLLSKDQTESLFVALTGAGIDVRIVGGQA